MNTKPVETGTPREARQWAQAEIKFVRVVRDCQHNDNTTNPREIIYDHEVHIDDEYRAVFKDRGTSRWSGRARYCLTDIDGRDILSLAQSSERYPDGSVKKYTADRFNKSDFETVVRSRLMEGMIPTAAQLEVLRAKDAADAEAERLDKLAMERDWRLKQKRTDMYALLYLFVCEMDRTDDADDLPAVAKQVRALLAEIDTPTPQSEN